MVNKLRLWFKKLISSTDTSPSISRDIYRIVDVKQHRKLLHPILKLQLINSSHVFNATPDEVLQSLSSKLSNNDVLLAMECKLKSEIQNEIERYCITDIDIDNEQIYYFLRDNLTDSDYLIEHFSLIKHDYVSKLSKKSLHELIDLHSHALRKKKTVCSTSTWPQSAMIF